MYPFSQQPEIAQEVLNASPVVCLRWSASNGWPVLYASDNLAQWAHTRRLLAGGCTTLTQLLTPDERERVVREAEAYAANGLDRFVQEFRLDSGDDTNLWVECRTMVRRRPDGAVSHYDGLLTDISQRKVQQEVMSEALAAQRQLNKKLEEAHHQLLQSEKMASIGQLAAGVAHELNNPIGFVHSNLGTLGSYLRDLMQIIDTYEQVLGEAAIPAELHHRIDRVIAEKDLPYLRRDIADLLAESLDGLARVRKIVQDLKSFSRAGEQEWQHADLHEGLDSTLNIVWNELKYKCQVHKEYGSLPPVHCIASQINQVFLNLLVNAGQAIETQGVITLRTGMADPQHVFVDIADTGRGIAPEHLNRIFEPFFTTKPVGKGTGLGLSLSYGIIERHHGRIEVQSTPGAGTTFRVILPVDSAGEPQGEKTP